MNGRAIVRFYLDGKLTATDVFAAMRDADIEQLATEHSKAAAGRPFMVEFEFPDMPEGERFFRFGTDDRGMVDPHAIDLTDETIVKGWKIGKLV